MARSPQVAKIGREMRAALSRTLSDVMLAAADAVENASPVQTGHLRSNFVLTTGAPYSGVDGSPDQVSTTAQEAGKARIRAYDVGRDGRIHLTNNVEYLDYLPGFVTGALMTAVRAAPRGMRRRAAAALKAMSISARRQGK